MKTYIFTKTDFYKDSKLKDFSKTFLCNGSDDIILEESAICDSVIFFKIKFEKLQNDLVVTITLFSWANDKSTYVPLHLSIWASESFGDGKNIPLIEKHYLPVINNLFEALEYLKYHWELKELFYKMKHPSFNFHYKLLNLFTQKELETICLENYRYYPRLNIHLLKLTPNKYTLRDIFLPHNVDGFYLYGMEISVDLDDSDYPTIEDEYSHIISKKEFMTKLKFQSKKG